MRTIQWLLLICLAGLFIGCATTQNGNNKKDQEVKRLDPLEGYNRVAFAFNRKFDKYIYRPVAVTYDTFVPDLVENRVDNFFDNLNQIPTIFNDIVQLDIYYIFNDTWRFAINSTFGLGGLFDVAKHIGLKEHYQDFGMTLGRWGYRPSSYLVLPFLGPSTIRDTAGSGVDLAASVWPYIHPIAVSYGLYGLKLVNARAQNLELDQMIEQAFDPYVFVRNGYLQMRDRLIDSDDQAGDSYIEPIATSGRTKMTYQGEEQDQDNAQNKPDDSRQDVIVVGGNN